MAKFNVIPAAAVGLGGPSATELADKLVTQAKDSNSLLRRQPLTRCAVHATVHKALDPSLPNMNDTEEDALEQVAADQEIQESGVPSISVYITGVRSLPLVQGTRKADVFLELELHGVLVSTKVVPADDAGTATFNSILRLPVRQGREGMSKVHVRIFDVAQALEGQAIGELSYTVDGLRHNYQNKEVNEGWFNVRGPNMGVVQGVGGDYAAVQLRIEYVPGASEASSTTVPTTVYPVYPVSHAALPPQPASAVSGEVSALPVLKPPLVLAAPGGDAHAPAAPRAVTTQLPTPPPVLSSSVGPAANIQAAAVQQGTLPLPHQITPPLPHKSAAATAVVNIMMLRSLPKVCPPLSHPPRPTHADFSHCCCLVCVVSCRRDMPGMCGIVPHVSSGVPSYATVGSSERGAEVLRAACGLSVSGVECAWCLFILGCLLVLVR